MPTEKEEKITKCPVCGGKFVSISIDGVHPVIPPGKTYFGLVDSGDWHPVETII